MSEKLILLVVDNPIEILAMLALSQGVINQTMIVRDGQEALEYLLHEGAFSDRLFGNPQVILLDLKLPRVDGIKVLQKIRATESTKLIPVIILTSSQQEKDTAADHGDSATSYLMKPVTIEQFSEAIQKILLYWIGLNRGIE